MKRYGYIRVFSKHQHIDRQVQAMEQAGLSRKQFVIDHQTGKTFQRKNYQKLVRKLKPGDKLYVQSIDWLGRNYEEIMEQWRYLTAVKQIDIIVLDFPLLDTHQPVQGITGKFFQVAKLWKQGDISLREGAEQLHVRHSTFSRWLEQNHLK